MPSPQSSAYQLDLAYIHDTGFGDFARAMAPGLLTILSDEGITDGLAVDLGCGSGLWARKLIDAGFRVIGVDQSEAMVDLARARVPEAVFHTQSIGQFQFPVCRVMTALGEVLNYLFDAQHPEGLLHLTCQRAFDALEPGGLLIFDVAGRDRCRHRPRSFWEGEGWACLVEFLPHPEQCELERRIVSFRQQADTSYRRTEEVHRQRLYDEEEVLKLLNRIGFKARATKDFGAPLAESVTGFVARKER